MPSNPAGTVVSKFNKLTATKAYVNTLCTDVQYATPVAGATVTSNGASTLIMNPAGTLATLTVVLPSSPSGGQRFSVVSSTAVTALTVSGGTIITAAVPTAMVAGVPLRFVYETTTAKWFSV